MTTSIVEKPKFYEGQTVEFMGGEGIIKNYRLEPSNWLYLVQMPMGAEPEMGKVSYETMIWLAEVDISPVCNTSRKMSSLE
ncbi:hypothetical protein [Calothrix sp. NIES-2098]|uniref:hypothetical protein n=1 Tax=Calothrix sp. NIES-2098 TaxID=1954171 RepID=UPI000B60BE34|nr:hypothetical protein NIES2098_34870 [Calothrix sp. NIES-2098]